MPQHAFLSSILNFPYAAPQTLSRISAVLCMYTGGTHFHQVTGRLLPAAFRAFGKKLLCSQQPLLRAGQNLFVCLFVF